MLNNNPSHPPHDDQRCIRTSSKRITRIEIIVGIMAVVLLALVCDKIRSSPQNNIFVTKAALGDIEDVISSFQYPAHNEDIHDRITQIHQETKADLRDMEHAITHLQNAIHTIDAATNNIGHESAEHTSMISDLQDKVAQIQKYQLQSTETKTNTKHIDKDTSFTDEEAFGELHLKPPKKYEESLQSNKIERRLDSSIFDHSQNHTHRCDELPLLSPANHLNNFQYDETMERTLDIIVTLSSMDLLHDYDTPQYKAACWILFDDIHQLNTTYEHFIQRYVMAVFLYTINPNKEDMLPPNTCDHQIIACDGEGKITSIVWSEFQISLKLDIFVRNESF